MQELQDQALLVRNAHEHFQFAQSAAVRACVTTTSPPCRPFAAPYILPTNI